MVRAMHAACAPGIYLVLLHSPAMQSFLDRLFRRPPAATVAPDAAPAASPEPAPAVAHYRQGNTLRGAGRLEEALASYDAAVALDPGYAHAWCNRGVVLQALGLQDRALASFDRAIGLDPRDAMAHYNRALLLQEAERWDDALSGYDQAIAADPQFADAQYNRALALLYRGDFARGWQAFEWRWKIARRLSIGERRDYAEPPWRGAESLAGRRILLHAEGGFGDTLQFCRYATVLAERGATVMLEVQEALVGLLGRMPGVTSVHAQGSPLPPFDFQCPLLSLPLACATTPDAIPGPSPYLAADAALIGQWEARLGPRTQPRIGLVWSGNPNNWIDHRRGVSLADWVPHLPPGFAYYRLQKDVREADRATLAATPAIHSFDDGFPDFDSTAALCACMDAVISTDTSVLHLAGALGRPTAALLSAVPDWRWLQGRPDCPWYPTMRLYRQDAPGDWLPVLRRVAADLPALRDSAGVP